MGVYANTILAGISSGYQALIGVPATGLWVARASLAITAEPSAVVGPGNSCSLVWYDTTEHTMGLQVWTNEVAGTTVEDEAVYNPAFYIPPSTVIGLQNTSALGGGNGIILNLSGWTQ